MAIEYKFNTWRLSEEQSEQWSNKAYKLLSYNNNSDQLNGFRIGQVLYFYHVKGMTAPQIRLAIGKGIPTNTIKGMIRGFKITCRIKLSNTNLL